MLVYIEGEIEVNGFTACGGCPGIEIELNKDFSVCDLDAFKAKLMHLTALISL